MRLIHTVYGLTYLVAQAAAAQPLPSNLVILEVLPGWRTDEGRHMAALRLTLAPGWKTYWRNPGAAGLAPILNFRASTGIEAVEVRWPTPDVFEFSGMRSIGYHDGVTIPLDLSLDEGPAYLAGQIDFGVCDRVCVPVSLEFAADLPAEGDRDPVIVAALADRPMTATEVGGRAVCTVAPNDNKLHLTVDLAMSSLGLDETVILETDDGGLWISEAESSRAGERLAATAEVLARDGGPPALDRSRVRITVLAEGRAVEFQGCQAS